MRQSDRLPGFPLAAGDEARGPVHEQRVVDVDDETVLVWDRVESDGRPPRSSLLELDRRGEIARSHPVGHKEIEPLARAARELPVEIGRHVVDSRRRSGRWEITLRCEESGDEARLAVLPRARTTRIIGLLAPAGSPEAAHDVAALEWASREGPSRLRGVLALDLRGGRARLHLERGLAEERSGGHEAASRHMTLAWLEDPDEVMAAYHLARLASKNGALDEALAFLGIAMNLDRRRARVMAAAEPDMRPLAEHPEFLRMMGPASDSRAAGREDDSPVALE